MTAKRVPAVAPLAAIRVSIRQVGASADPA